MRDDARTVDALAKHTVRCVLFPGLRKSESFPRSPLRVVSDASTDTKVAVVLPFDIGRHHEHVLSYGSWSDAQLLAERRRLKHFLRVTQQQSRPEHDEEEDTTTTESTVAMEAFALLELFRHERLESSPNAASSRLLHAQLALFAEYFEKCHRRTILHDWDIVTIQRSYQSFLDNQE